MVEARGNRLRQLAHNGLLQQDPSLERFVEEFVGTEVSEEIEAEDRLVNFQKIARKMAAEKPQVYEMSTLRLGLEGRTIALSAAAVESEITNWGTAYASTGDVKTQHGAVLSVCSTQEINYIDGYFDAGNRLCITIQNSGEDEELKRAMGKFPLGRIKAIMINTDELDDNFGNVYRMVTVRSRGKEMAFLNSSVESHPVPGKEKDYALARLLIARIKESEKYQQLQVQATQPQSA
jgi:hypothetical protein